MSWNLSCGMLVVCECYPGNQNLLEPLVLCWVKQHVKLQARNVLPKALVQVEPSFTPSALHRVVLAAHECQRAPCQVASEIGSAVHHFWLRLPSDHGKCAFASRPAKPHYGGELTQSMQKRRICILTASLTFGEELHRTWQYDLAKLVGKTHF